MITERAAKRIIALTLACMVLFVLSCEYSYVHRGYLAVGGEYAFFLIPFMALAVEWLGGGE